MLFKEVIKKKRDGLELTSDEIQAFVAGATSGLLPDYQLSAWLMAATCRGLNARETADLTLAMMRSGTTVDFHEQGQNREVLYIDKHSSGGVGDKVSLILAPLMACLGVKVPMISGRGLGHTGGTLDKLEAIRGFQIQQSLANFKRLVDEVGCALIGQSADLAPADRKLYALRDVTGTVESAELICASILSKKFAAGIDGLVMDIKVGSGAFMKTVAEAEGLAAHLRAIGKIMKRPISTIFTDMSQPLGRTVGNALEVGESLAALGGDGDADLMTITMELGVEMLRLANVETERSRALERMQQAIASGAALRKMAQLIAAQGGDANVCDQPSRLPQAKSRLELLSETTGYLSAIDTESVGLAAILLGAGRQRTEDKVDPAVGFTLHKKIGDAVQSGEPFMTLHFNSATHLDEVRQRLLKAYHVGQQPVAKVPPVYKKVNV